MKIQVLSNISVKAYGPNHIVGREQFTSKKEFLKAVGKHWDAVRDNAAIRVKLQLDNVE